MTSFGFPLGKYNFEYVLFYLNPKIKILDSAKSPILLILKEAFYIKNLKPELNF